MSNADFLDALRFFGFIAGILVLYWLADRIWGG